MIYERFKCTIISNNNNNNYNAFNIIQQGEW